MNPPLTANWPLVGQIYSVFRSAPSGLIVCNIDKALNFRMDKFTRVIKKIAFKNSKI